MFKDEFDLLSEHVIRSQYSEEIELSTSLLDELDDVFKGPESIGYPLNSCAKECIFVLKTLSLSDIESILIKAFWIIDTYQGSSEYYRERLDCESNVFSDMAFGKHLFGSIDFFDLSPLEELQVTWVHLFSVIALDRLAQLYFISIKATVHEKLLMQHKIQNVKLIYIDVIDCVSKAKTFEKLLDEGWVKSYHAKRTGMVKIAKLNPLKKIVLIRCIKEHRDVDHLSAANAIECQLVEENCPELSLLTSKKRRAKTFAEWISALRNGALKVPV